MILFHYSVQKSSRDTFSIMFEAALGSTKIYIAWCHIYWTVKWVDTQAQQQLRKHTNIHTEKKKHSKYETLNTWLEISIYILYSFFTYLTIPLTPESSQSNTPYLYIWVDSMTLNLTVLFIYWASLSLWWLLTHLVFQRSTVPWGLLSGLCRPYAVTIHLVIV